MMVNKQKCVTLPLLRPKSFRDDRGQPLYSLGICKFVCENKTFDICVADCRAGEVFGVSVTGKFLFRYTGPPSTTYWPFKPFGFITNNRASILTADHANNRIHIIDQIGNFPRYIDNCDLHHPMDLRIWTPVTTCLLPKQWKLK